MVLAVSKIKSCGSDSVRVGFRVRWRADGRETEVDGFEETADGLERRSDGGGAGLEGVGGGVGAVGGGVEAVGAMVEGVGGRLVAVGAWVEGVGGHLEGVGARLEGVGKSLETTERLLCEMEAGFLRGGAGGNGGAWGRRRFSTIRLGIPSFQGGLSGSSSKKTNVKKL